MDTDQTLAAFRLMAANLIRVARGGDAGDALGLLEQVRAIAAAIENGARPTEGQIREALKVGIYRSPSAYRSDVNEWMIDDGDEQIIDGALILAAARLGGGPFKGAQAARGRERMFNGIKQRQQGVDGNLKPQ